MRRLLMVLVAVVATVQPAFADDNTARQNDVQQQLAAASTDISNLNLQMAAAEQSADQTRQRIAHERGQVRMLARTLYVQPDSLAGMLFQSSSVSEAMTRIADLTSAGNRAAATKRALDQDLTRLSKQKAQ